MFKIINVILFILSTFPAFYTKYISIKTNRIVSPSFPLTNNITKFIISNNTVQSYASLPISNYWNIQYYGYIYLGSNKMRMTVVYDTGSNLLWVPSPLCTSCRVYSTKYDAQLSTTAKYTNEKKNISYALGFVSGDVIEDTISINDGEASIDSFRFVLANEERDLNGTIPDGVLGLGISTENNTHNSLVYSLFQNSLISSPSFSFYLTDSKKESRLFIGDISYNSYIQKLFRETTLHMCVVPQDTQYWACDLLTVTLSINSTNNISFTSQSKVLFDSGTSYIIMPTQEYNSIMGFLVTRNNSSNICGLTPENQIACQCNSTHHFGSITLDFGNKSYFNINLEDIIDYFPTENYQCVFQIIVSDKLNNTWILGDSALRSTLITFNMDKRSIQWIKMKTLFNEEEMIRDDSDSHKNAIFYIWTIAGGAFLILISVLAYYFMK